MTKFASPAFLLQGCLAPVWSLGCLLALGCSKGDLQPSAPPALHMPLHAAALTSGTVYRLRNECSGKVLDVSEVSQANGALVHLWLDFNNPNQQWKLEATDNEFYKLTAQHSGKALEAKDAQATNGTPMQQWAYVGNPNQQWQLIEAGNGYYEVHPRHAPGQALDVAGAGTANGAKVQLYTDNNTCAQHWQLEPVGSSPPPPSSTARFYSDTSPFNTPIEANPVLETNSAAIVDAALVKYASRANFANTDEWGVSLVYATAQSTSYSIACTQYFCTGPITFKIPAGALPTTDGDHHLVVVDGTKSLDMWDAHYDSSTDTWSAGSRFITDLYGSGYANCPAGQRCGSAYAAGFAGMAGVVRPEEIAQGHIDHALSMMTAYSRAGMAACPASNYDGVYTDVNALPEGARIQLDPAFDVDAQNWPAWEKVLAKALQRYGAYVSDKGGSNAFYGQTDMNQENAKWSAAGVPKGGSLANLPWSRFRVLKITKCL